MWSCDQEKLLWQPEFTSDPNVAARRLTIWLSAMASGSHESPFTSLQMVTLEQIFRATKLTKYLIYAIVDSPLICQLNASDFTVPKAEWLAHVRQSR